MQKAKTDIIAAYDKPSLLIDDTLKVVWGQISLSPAHFCNLKFAKTSALIVGHNQVLYYIRNSQTG